MRNYNLIQKVLHDLVLSKKFINKSLYELEKIIYLKNTDIKSHSHIFISSLPRSGTTTLLNFIYSLNEFGSLKYRNIPFIFSPNFSKLFNNNNIIKKERMHGDGINYDINSPEAFDEIFFSCNENFTKNELINYLQLILISEKKNRYLSKNNLNYKRIDLIRSILPNSIFLIPVREPLQHSYSLLNQHLHFSRLQKKDDFIRRYMNYLGHNEFGLNHIAWNKPINFNDLNNINYWLEQWTLFYKNIQEKYKNYKNCHFVVYEKLTDQNYINLLLKKIDIKIEKNTTKINFKNFNKEKININFEKNLYENSKNIYNKFII